MNVADPNYGARVQTAIDMRVDLGRILVPDRRGDLLDIDDEADEGASVPLVVTITDGDDVIRAVCAVDKAFIRERAWRIGFASRLRLPFVARRQVICLGHVLQLDSDFSTASSRTIL